MSLNINTNTAALNSARNLYNTQGGLQTSLQRLSSGLRVNSAKDDSAGLAIAERMNTQVRGMKVSVRNANDGISLAQTAEGALGNIGEQLQRMRELAVQGASGQLDQTKDTAYLQTEFAELQAEIGRVISTTKFNGQAILDGAADKDFKIQVGADNTANDQITVKSAKLDKVASATAAAAKVSTSADASAAIATLDTAIDNVNSARATLGAGQNRLSATVATLQSSIENQSAARGRIMDADFASETANLSRNQVLQQAGTAMLAQANQLPQQVLQLLR